MIRAIFYDLDGTLRTDQPQGHEVFLEYAAAKQLGIQNDEETRRKVVRWEHNYWAQAPEMISDRLNHPERDGFWVQYSHRQLKLLGLEDSHASHVAPQVYEHMKNHFRPENMLMPETANALEQLQKNGYRMAVLSNRDHAFDHLLSGLQIDHYFEFTVFAGQLQCYKPHADFFYHALKQIGMTASEVVYVGDNFYADAIGARNAGLHAILLDPKNIFPEADCPIIRSLNELPAVLATMHQSGT